MNKTTKLLATTGLVGILGICATSLRTPEVELKKYDNGETWVIDHRGEKTKRKTTIYDSRKGPMETTVWDETIYIDENSNGTLDRIITQTYTVRAGSFGLDKFQVGPDQVMKFMNNTYSNYMSPINSPTTIEEVPKWRVKGKVVDSHYATMQHSYQEIKKIAK